MEKKSGNQGREKIVSHVIFNRRNGDMYISLPRNAALYKKLLVAIAQNSGSAKGLRVEIELETWKIRVYREAEE